MVVDRELTNRLMLRARDAMDTHYREDLGIRDPFGNAIRIGQMFDGTLR